ncbi:MAG TPA: molecular chaperone DnaK, partial [Cyanobacteria bacterium UBA11148]|nr:molecular chaperone DnaK [Cyanobacteria bacterium UBA11148]
DRKNQADSLTYQAEKQINELGDKVPAADKTKVEGLIKDLKDAVEKEDDERIKTLTPELQQALYGISANLYQQSGGGSPDDGSSGPTGGAGGADATSGGSGTGDDVIDAEFSESK